MARWFFKFAFLVLLLLICMIFPSFIANGASTVAFGALPDIFQAQQDTLTSPDQPKSALFQKEAGASQRAIGSGWFLFGLYVLIALIFSGLSGYAAVAKGLNPIPYFFLGFFFSVVGYLYVLTRPSTAKPGEVPSGFVKVPTTFAPVPCPKCGYTNHPAAKKCLGCGAELQPTMQSEVSRTK